MLVLLWFGPGCKSESAPPEKPLVKAVPVESAEPGDAILQQGRLTVLLMATPTLADFMDAYDRLQGLKVGVKTVAVDDGVASWTASFNQDGHLTQLSATGPRSFTSTVAYGEDGRWLEMKKSTADPSEYLGKPVYTSEGDYEYAIFKVESRELLFKPTYEDGVLRAWSLMLSGNPVARSEFTFYQSGLLQSLSDTQFYPGGGQQNVLTADFQYDQGGNLASLKAVGAKQYSKTYAYFFDEREHWLQAGLKQKKSGSTRLNRTIEYY